MLHYSIILTDPLSSFGSEAELHNKFAIAKECGFEGIELGLNEPLSINLDHIEQRLADLDLVVPAFLTGEAYSKEKCLSSPDSSVRRRAVEQLIRYLDVSGQFNAILVIGLLQGLRSDEPDEQLAKRRIVESLREVAAAAEQKGVEFVIEPVNHLQVGFNHTVSEVLALIREINSPAAQPMVDTIHLNIEETSLTVPIHNCGQELRHVHLCESNGSLLGTGHIDFGEVLNALAEICYEAFASVKVYRGCSYEQAARSSMEFLNSLDR